MTFCFSGSWGRLSILTYICFNRVESSELKVYPSLKGNTRCCYFCYFSCKPFNWHWWSFQFLFFVPSVLWVNRCSHGFSQKHTMAMRQCMSPSTLETLVGQGDHPRDWAALQMSKKNLVAFSQSIKSREDHFVNVTRQYQVTVAFLLKIKLWRGIIGTGSVGTRRLVMRRFFESNCYGKLPENVMISTEFSRLSCYLHGSHRHHSFHEVHGGMLLIQSWCLMFHYFETFKGLWWIMGCKPNMPILVAFYSNSLE